ncbi:hypothetical protein FIBSPDRAFT_852448, partial [Athelia psychrophila]
LGQASIWRSKLTFFSNPATSRKLSGVWIVHLWHSCVITTGSATGPSRTFCLPAAVELLLHRHCTIHRICVVCEAALDRSN